MTEAEVPGEIRYLYGMFEGTMPDGSLAGYAVSTAADTPPEALEIAARMGVQGLTIQYPGVTEVKQVGDWAEAVVYLDSDDEDETTEDA